MRHFLERVKHKRICPKCYQGRLITVFDEPKGEEFDKCSRYGKCDYTSLKRKIKKPPKRD